MSDSSNETRKNDYTNCLQQIENVETLIKDIGSQMETLNRRKDHLKNRLIELVKERNQYTPPEGSRVQRFVDKIVDGFMANRRSVDKDVTREEVLHFARNIIDYDRSYVDWNWNVAPGHKWWALLLQYRCIHDGTHEPAHWHGSNCIHELHIPYDETAQKWAEGYRLSCSKNRIAKAPSYAAFDKKTGSYEYPDTDWNGRPCTYHLDAIDYIVFFAFPNQLKD